MDRFNTGIKMPQNISGFETTFKRNCDFMIDGQYISSFLDEVSP